MVTTVTDNSPQSINTSLFAMDSEIQKVKKIAESFDEKLSGIDIETGVLSVNGKQGVVELDASDVDALPSSTVIPTTTSELENTSGFITSSDSITGNAATATTADKVKNSLTINGKTYDGSSAVDAGVQTITNGGTGQTTQAGINKAFVGGLEEGTSDVTDGTMFVSSWASDNGFSDTNAVNVPYKRKFSRVWEYIKGKISSVLGLTASSYGGKANTAGTADKVASEGVSTMWIYGRNNAVLKTTSAAAANGWKAFASIKTASGSIEIGNLSGEDFIRVVYSSDADVSAGNNNVTQLLYIRRGNIEVLHKLIATSVGIRIPTSQPISLEDGDIWIS